MLIPPIDILILHLQYQLLYFIRRFGSSLPLLRFLQERIFTLEYWIDDGKAVDRSKRGGKKEREEPDTERRG